VPTVTPKAYFEAGHDLLAEGGIQVVTIANLCERLGVTKGSFYHHFRSVEDFHDRLLDDWFTEHVARRKAVTDALTDPLQRLEAMRRFAVDRRHDTEAAIRAWARSSPRAAEVQRRIDNTRRAYVVDLCRALGIDRRRAHTFAELSIITLAGAQNLCRPVDRVMVARITDELVRQILAAAAHRHDALLSPRED
jgi:AcrR family transcriptional regulator